MKRITIISIFLLFVCSFINIFAQDQHIIDSLKQVLKKAKHDTISLSILDALANAEKDTKLSIGYDEQIETLAQKNLATNPPVLIKNTFLKFLANAINRKGVCCFYQGDISKSLEYFNKCLKIREEINDKIGISTSLNAIGIIYSSQGDIPNALKYYNKSLKNYESIGDKIGISKSLHNISIIYFNQGDIPMCLEYNNKSLKIEEEIGDKRGISKSLNNIGLIYYFQKDNSKALEYYNRSLKICEEISRMHPESIEWKIDISTTLNNVGLIYQNQANIAVSKKNNTTIDSLFTKALEYYNKSLMIRYEIEDKNGISMSLNNVGILYYDQACEARSMNNIVRSDSLFSIAMDYYKKSLQIREELNDKSGVSGSLNNIGRLYLEKNETLKAFDYAKKAYRLAKETGYVEDVKIAAKLLEEIYAKLGNYKLSRQYFGEYITMRDSISKEENQKNAQKKYFQYQYEKKTATDSITHSKAIEIKNLEIDKQKVESKKQRILIFSFLAGFIIILVFSIFLYHLFTQKKKANITLAHQKKEISTQRDEIEAQRDRVSEQNVMLFEQKKEITDSINYAKRIQTAVLPNGEYANNILGNHFILFKPKDIVSGDFYWATKVNEWLLVTVADCTGHGVPGAFMSMLGVSFLNEIVRKKVVTKASDVLDNLRTSIIDALSQTGEAGTQKDGMDIVLCAINTNDNSMQFAGANNTLYIVNSNKELIEVKPDKQPVAIYEYMTPFTNHIIQLNTGDTLYLMSDGYQDQFGGEKFKKFMSKRLKEMLVEISDKPMSEQKEIMNTTLENWKGEHEQVDDITVMGIKV